MHPLPEICNFGVLHGPLPAPDVLRIDPSWWFEMMDVLRHVLELRQLH